jgi:hAT family C-terminal dimerisation region
LARTGSENGYLAALNKVAASRVTQDEYDRYMTTESPIGTTLESWGQLQHSLPRLSLMARDIFAIPATGARVERQFSKSRRIDTWALEPSIVCESMRFNDYLRRRGTPLVAGKRRWLLLELVSPVTHEGDENDDKDGDNIPIPTLCIPICLFRGLK